ncbi:hypothetical protein LR48_Vigan08g050300 [Vigna angularis]|uniref:Uncharacterized protein n=1 Tax=Phaseolus angularis TaxID=3914 RepID=A0A0L9V3W8_PHAAN|nr:hypothetical protein LR48_Vigan08g050300 [Vigna angularis]
MFLLTKPSYNLRNRIRIGYYHRLGERHLPKPEGSNSLNERSPSERTLVAQRTVVRRPASGRSSPSEWTLVAQRGRSSSSQWTLVQRVDARDQQVDARPARRRSSTSEDARPASGGHSPSERALVTQQLTLA